MGHSGRISEEIDTAGISAPEEGAGPDILVVTETSAGGIEVLILSDGSVIIVFERRWPKTHGISPCRINN